MILNDSITVPTPPEILISRSVRVVLFICILPCSLICTFFVLYHLFTNKIHRQCLYNHPLIFLLLSGLLFQLIDLPLQIDYLNLGHIRYRSPIICLIWIFIEFWCHSTNSLLLTWASFERHILIFHNQWLLKSKSNKIFYHYIPLIILFLYLCIYYFITIIFPSCSTIFDYNSQLCGFFPCFLTNSPFLAIWDAIVHNTIPTLLITIFNATLFIRIFWQKYHLHQLIHWRKYRKTAFQLFIISIFYLTIHFPMMLNVCLLLTGVNNPIIIKMGPYLVYLSYYIILSMPFICLLSIWKVNNRSNRRRRNIFPMNNNIAVVMCN